MRAWLEDELCGSLKVLKSDFKLEESRLRSADRLVRFISIYCILDWRIQWITMPNWENISNCHRLRLIKQIEKHLEHTLKKQNQWHWEITFIC